MLRELAELVETVTADTPLILALEDLHWSDYATLDLVSLLARRRVAARRRLGRAERDRGHRGGGA
jgi:predicted ATPase